jgi:hypothetical protein
MVFEYDLVAGIICIRRTKKQCRSLRDQPDKITNPPVFFNTEVF